MQIPFKQLSKFLRESIITDDEYFAAVESGDMETAQRMVREAAAKAMPNTKVVGDNKLPLIVYHGGNLTKIYPGEIYTSDERDVARGYGKKNALFLNIENPRIIAVNGNTSDDVFGETANDEDATTGTSTDRIVSDTMYDYDSSYDGVIFYDIVDIAVGNDVLSNVFVAFNMNGTQIKSADPVTYDDAGEVIPLSKRFDMNNMDIRY